jgi:anti-anti-sigma regulatory factor
MTATIYCDTMAIRTLVMAHRQAAVTGTELQLVVTSPSILRVMELLGIHKVLSVYARLDEALAGQNRLGFG